MQQRISLIFSSFEHKKHSQTPWIVSIKNLPPKLSPQCLLDTECKIMITQFYYVILSIEQSLNQGQAPYIPSFPEPCTTQQPCLVFLRLLMYLVLLTSNSILRILICRTSRTPNDHLSQLSHAPAHSGAHSNSSAPQMTHRTQSRLRVI